MLTISPASKSPWAVVWVAVHDAVAPGANTDTSQTIDPGSATGSTTDTNDETVTFPVFVTVTRCT